MFFKMNCLLLPSFIDCFTESPVQFVGELQYLYSWTSFTYSPVMEVSSWSNQQSYEKQENKLCVLKIYKNMLSLNWG